MTQTSLPSPLPIVAAPMAGGASTTALVVAVTMAGGFGFLASGYLRPDRLGAQLSEMESITDQAYGVNVFMPSAPTQELSEVLRYRTELEPMARELGIELGEPRWSDDGFEEKLDIICAHRAAAVSFTFGAPSAELCERIRSATGAVVIATVTQVSEAELAVANGVDMLCLQGAEAGAHRGVFEDDASTADGGGLLGLADLLTRVREMTPTPLIAAGGIMDGAGIASVLRRGAVAAQLGTAFLCCPEAGTSLTHRRALLDRTYSETALTRAFTGRPARGLLNEYARAHSAHAPAAYPEVHYLTQPLRAAAAAAGRPDLLHLWAGTGWRSVTEEPAGQLTARLAAELAASPTRRC